MLKTMWVLSIVSKPTATIKLLLECRPMAVWLENHQWIPWIFNFPHMIQELRFQVLLDRIHTPIRSQSAVNFRVVHLYRAEVALTAIDASSCTIQALFRSQFMFAPRWEHTSFDMFRVWRFNMYLFTIYSTFVPLLMSLSDIFLFVEEIPRWPRGWRLLLAHHALERRHGARGHEKQ